MGNNNSNQVTSVVVAPPQYNNVIYADNIPNDLKNLKQWVNWSFVHNGNKWTKPPKKVGTFSNASCNMPLQWAVFSDALNWYKKKKSNNVVKTYTSGIHYIEGICGVGFQLTESDDFIAIDIDDCFNQKDKLKDYALEIVERLESYTEISPSGKGLHIFLKENKCFKGHKNPKFDVEIYSKGRYMTITGNCFAGTAKDIKSNNDGLNWLLDKYFTNKSGLFNNDQGNMQVTHANSDEQIIYQLKKENSKASKLYFDNDISEFDDDDSKADFTLMLRLAYYTNGNPEQMERIFSGSAIGKREKWQDRDDYRERTIEKAIEASNKNRASELSRIDNNTPVNDVLNDFRYLKDGKPLPVIENVYVLLQHLGIKVRFDVIKKRSRIIGTNDIFGSLEISEDAKVSAIISECNKIGFPTSNIKDFLNAIALQNPYNPILDWIEETQWDGTDYLQQLCNTVTCRSDFSSNFKDLLIKKWVISGVVMVCNDTKENFSKGVLTFQGNQNIGKTTWFVNLLPKSLFDWALEGTILRLDNKDSLITATEHWLIELGELESTFRKSDIARLKAFLTSRKDVYRDLYGRMNSDHSRRTAFFASVNQAEFLRDDTGNCRFWVIPVVSLKTDHQINLQQMWAQAYTLFKNGEIWYLKEEESALLEKYNEDSREIDPIEEKIKSWIYDYNGEKTDMTASEVLAKIGYETPTQAELKKAGFTLKKLVGNQQRNSKRRYYDLSNLKSDSEE
jgi:hypothetical protein